MTTPDPDDLAEWSRTSIAGAIRDEYEIRLAIPTDVRAQMSVIQARYGSNRASARATGVDDRSWRRWLTGSTPVARNASRIAATAARVRADRITVSFSRVHFTQRMGGQTRNRVADTRGLYWRGTANDQISGHVRRRHWGRAARAWFLAIRDAQYAQLFDPFGEYLDDPDYGVIVTRMDM